MRARWASFGIGLWLVLAPLVLGYDAVGAVLYEIALGLLVSVLALAALESQAARLAMAPLALWLAAAPPWTGFPSGAAAANELVAGLALGALALVPGAKVAEGRAPAKLAA